VICNKLIPNWY